MLSVVMCYAVSYPYRPIVPTETERQGSSSCEDLSSERTVMVSINSIGRTRLATEKILESLIPPLKRKEEQEIVITVFVLSFFVVLHVHSRMQVGGWVDRYILGR